MQALWPRGESGIRIEGRTKFANLTIRATNSGDLNGDGREDFAFAEGENLYVIYGLSASTKYVRGDSNFDGKLDLSDVIFILSYLFVAGEAPRCEDAVDSDDNGILEITDAIYLLGHLFLGTAVPPTPYPEEGEDPTDDSLTCVGF